MENNLQNGAFAPEKIDVGAVHSNLTTEVIKITSDKMELIITQHLSKVERRKEWMTPLGLIVAIIIALSTTTFKDALWLKANVWEAIAWVSLVVLFFWLIKSGWRSYKSKSIPEIISMIKADNSK